MVHSASLNLIGFLSIIGIQCTQKATMCSLLRAFYNMNIAPLTALFTLSGSVRLVSKLFTQLSSNLRDKQQQQQQKQYNNFML